MSEQKPVGNREPLDAWTSEATKSWNPCWDQWRGVYSPWSMEEEEHRANPLTVLKILPLIWASSRALSGEVSACVAHWQIQWPESLKNFKSHPYSVSKCAYTTSNHTDTHSVAPAAYRTGWSSLHHCFMWELLTRKLRASLFIFSLCPNSWNISPLSAYHTLDSELCVLFTGPVSLEAIISIFPWYPGVGIKYHIWKYLT